LVNNALNAQRSFLNTASKSKKPSDADLPKLLDPTSKLMNDIVAIREKNRANAQFNWLSTLSEGISALGWVAVSPTPGPFVNEARASSEFYSNKLLVEAKQKSLADQTEWVHYWNNFLKELFNYIKKFHTTGVTWNPRGGDALSASAAPAAAPRGPPPPPAAAPKLATSEKAAPDTSALFAALNKGSDVTTGLKKVTKDMKTSNQPGRSSLVPSGSEKEAPKKAPAGSAAQKRGEPKTELQGNKWAVEWHQGNKSIVIDETEPKQTVYVYKLENSVVKVVGKINNITVDSCKKTAIVFDNAISSCELVNCTGCEVQVTGKVPSVAIDKCSGISVFLSKDALDVTMVTSKSDSMNVLIPDPAGGQDPLELPVPEQYQTRVVNGKLETHHVEHKG